MNFTNKTQIKFDLKNVSLVLTQMQYGKGRVGRPKVGDLSFHLRDEYAVAKFIQVAYHAYMRKRIKRVRFSFYTQETLNRTTSPKSLEWEDALIPTSYFPGNVPERDDDDADLVLSMALNPNPAYLLRLEAELEGHHRDSWNVGRDSMPLIVAWGYLHWAHSVPRPNQNSPRAYPDESYPISHNDSEPWAN